MPALSYKSRFVDPVVTGRKPHSIRAWRESASMGGLYRRPTSRLALGTWLDAVYARTRGDRAAMRRSALRARSIENPKSAIDYPK